MNWLRITPKGKSLKAIHNPISVDIIPRPLRITPKGKSLKAIHNTENHGGSISQLRITPKGKSLKAIHNLVQLFIDNMTVANYPER